MQAFFNSAQGPSAEIGYTQQISGRVRHELADAPNSMSPQHSGAAGINADRFNVVGQNRLPKAGLDRVVGIIPTMPRGRSVSIAHSKPFRGYAQDARGSSIIGSAEGLGPPFCGTLDPLIGHASRLGERRNINATQRHGGGKARSVCLGADGGISTGVKPNVDAGFGVMIKESDGSLQVQYTTTLPRILGEFDTGTADGALSFPTLAGGTPFFFIVGSAGIASFLNMPVIVASGTTISWYFVSPEERLSVRVAFGRIG